MTEDRARKRAIRARMEADGVNYTTAMRRIDAEREGKQAPAKEDEK